MDYGVSLERELEKLDKCDFPTKVKTVVEAWILELIKRKSDNVPHIYYNKEEIIVTFSWVGVSLIVHPEGIIFSKKDDPETDFLEFDLHRYKDILDFVLQNL